MDVYDFHSSIKTQGLFQVEKFQKLTKNLNQQGLVMFMAGTIISKISLFDLSDQTRQFIDNATIIVSLIESGRLFKRQFLTSSLHLLQKIDKLIQIDNQHYDFQSNKNRMNYSPQLLKIANQTFLKLLSQIQSIQSSKPIKISLTKQSKAEQKDTMEALNMIFQQWKQMNPDQQVQMTENDKISPIIDQNKHKNKPKQNICGVCTKKLGQNLTTQCNHKFHTICFKKYIQRSISQRKANLNCPKRNCNRRISLQQVKNLVKDDIEFIKFIQLEKQYETQKDRLIKRQCPNATCTATFELGSCRFRYKCPHCLKDYCMSCKSFYHTGKSCEQYRVGKEIKVENNLASFRRQKNHFKQCPKCYCWVQKISGVNCLVCKCGVEFCLKCGGTACQRQMCFGSGYKKRNKIQTFKI